jgi:proliferating cell nuclear antigen
MPDAKVFRNVLTAIASLIDEATFYLDSEGIKLRAMDPSRVAMVDFEMQKSAFTEFVSSEKTKICLSLTELLKLLRRAGKDESLEIFLDEKTGKFTITIRGKYTRNFKMPTLEVADEDVPLPKISFNTKITITTEGLRRAFEDVALVSDHVSIEANNDKLMMNAKGDIMGANIELEKGSETILSLESKETSKATFSLSYLSDIVRSASSTSEIVSLEFSTDMPIYLDFKQTYEGKLTYFLAPRIEVE